MIGRYPFELVAANPDPEAEQTSPNSRAEHEVRLIPLGDNHGFYPKLPLIPSQSDMRKRPGYVKGWSMSGDLMNRRRWMMLSTSTHDELTDL